MVAEVGPRSSALLYLARTGSAGRAGKAALRNARSASSLKPGTEWGYCRPARARTAPRIDAPAHPSQSSVWNSRMKRLGVSTSRYADAPSGPEPGFRGVPPGFGRGPLRFPHTPSNRWRRQRTRLAGLDEPGVDRPEPGLGTRFLTGSRICARRLERFVGDGQAGACQPPYGRGALGGTTRNPFYGRQL
jgi:hypothetical protein